MIAQHGPYRLDSIYMSGTYSGCYEGAPTPEEVISYAKEKIGELWGSDRPIHVIQPVLRQVRGPVTYKTPALLPPWQILAWLTGPAFTKEDDGSHVFIIKYAAGPYFDIETTLGEFKWEEHAKGFGF